MSEPIRVIEVRSRSDLRRFMGLPQRVYANDSNWIAPLRQEVRKLLDRRRNPFFDHGEACFWVACRGDTPVGRISAQINHLHLETHGDATGNFGFLEAIDEPAIFQALLTVAEAWVRARGMTRILGPYSLSINDEIGVLISGFEYPPVAGMSHSPRYYPARLEAEGYAKAKDVHAFRFELEETRNKAVSQLLQSAARINRDGRVRVRQVDMRRLKLEMRAAIAVYNDAWSANWGFVPVTPREVEYLLTAVRPIIRPAYTLVGEVDQRIEGFFMALPDLNELIADLGGRLFPLGWAKLLWRLRMSTPKGSRAMLAGLSRTYQNSALGASMLVCMLADVIKNAHAAGFQWVELSWVLEDNTRSMALCHQVGGQIYKTYRLYQKTLA
jgi:hypothetical protein